MSTAQHRAPDTGWFITANRDLGPLEPPGPGRHRKHASNPLRRLLRRLRNRLGGTR